MDDEFVKASSQLSVLSLGHASASAISRALKRLIVIAKQSLAFSEN